MPKYIKNKSYYGLINGLPKSDDRIPELKKQYKERGFDDTEIWSLYNSIARYVLPRLKRFREIHGDYPANLTAEEWNKILDKMIKAFELISEDTLFEFKDEVEEGLSLFRIYFFDLWC